VTLRTRLFLAAGLATIVLVGVLGGVALRQRSVLTDQLDGQLVSLGSNFERFSTDRGTRELDAVSDQSSDVENARTPPLGEVYAAIITGVDTTVIARPVSQPDLAVPLNASVLSELQNPSEPFTLDVAGTAGGARVVAVQIDDDSWVVAAISTESIEDAQRQLLITGAAAVALLVAALGLIMWWVDRLGIRPIVNITEAAEGVAEGLAETRVEHPPETTEAGRLGAAFNTMLDKRQAAETKQRRFIADASHELRTPLTTLRGYTTLYANGGLTDAGQVDDAMRRINTEATRMSALVDDLLTLAALDDQRPLKIRSVDLTQLLRDIASDAHAVQPDRPIHIEAIDAGVTVQADVHQLTQALTTIVTNALRHTATEADLSFAVSRHAETVVVEIGDTGSGIDPEQVETLFDRFYRADKGRSRDRGGYGLGLSIAKAVVEAHQGSIDIRSRVGTGTTVTIKLPTPRNSCVS